jgi:hypothetical protein
MYFKRYLNIFKILFLHKNKILKMEVGDKDIYEYISNFTDDKTTINMIMANRKVFDNEKFYEKVMRKRYPLLIEFRKENETWKALYLRMVYTLAKLQEDYQIPYIPTKGCNPERLAISSTSDVYNESLRCAAAGGNIPLIEYFLEKGATNVNEASAEAGKYSNLDTVKYLIGKGARNYEGLLTISASRGKIDITRFVLDALRLKGFDIEGYYGRTALQNAILGGHIEVIKFLIDHGITIKPFNIEYAESKGKHDIAQYMKQFL